LIVDLTAIVAGREDGSSNSAGAPAPPPASRAGAKTGSARSGRAVARDDASVPAPPVTVPPESTSSAAVATSRETPPPSPSTAVGLAPAADVAAPIASQSVGPSAVVGSGRQDGVGVDTGAVGSGGAGGDRIAALGIAGGGGSDYAAYLARLRQRIQQTLRYPSAARRRGVTGTVHLEIAIEPDGAVGAVSVIKTSAHEILDRAAVDAARSVPRLPFPDDVRPRGLRVRLPVVFELQ
jgi:protein TonB